MKLFSILLLLFSLPVMAGNPHHDHTPPPPVNVPDDGSNHNALAIAVIVGIGVCAYYKCWKPKPVKAETSLVPELPENEYIRTTIKRPGR